MLLDWFRRVYPPRTLAITGIISIIVWFAGPLGTFDAMTPGIRLFYWGGLIMGSVPFAYSVRMMVSRRWRDLSLAKIALVTATLLSVLYTPVVYLATKMANLFGLADMVAVWMMWAGTFLAAACTYAVRALLIEQERPAATPAGPTDPTQPRLMQRIDAGTRGQLLSISVRDHYVDVRTSAGQASLLMRLSDAIAETEGVAGAQVHRSHWIAWDAVTGVDRRGGNLVLRMADGGSIPVSRNHREKLEERGLI